MTEPRLQLHAPGACHHDSTCDGVGRWVPDPFDEDVWGETNYGWFCDGLYQVHCDEI